MNPFLYVGKKVLEGTLKMAVKRWLGIDKLDTRMRDLEKDAAKPSKPIKFRHYS